MTLSVMQLVVKPSGVMLVVTFYYYSAECHYAECCRAECHYAECRYAECRGARKQQQPQKQKFVGS
jgi:hypothetical protein